jgi:hypothetical protein
MWEPRSLSESSFQKRKGGLDLAKYGLDLAGPEPETTTVEKYIKESPF